jgi:transcriptional regulator with XRE-family HTH domain
MTKKNNSKAMAELSVEMAKPRVVASVRADANVFAYFKGIFARVAHKLNVSPSMVSRVANGHRSSPKIRAALLEELSYWPMTATLCVPPSSNC